jgi:hypothetical protein
MTVLAIQWTWAIVLLIVTIAVMKCIPRDDYSPVHEQTCKEHFEMLKKEIDNLNARMLAYYISQVDDFNKTYFGRVSKKMLRGYVESLYDSIDNKREELSRPSTLHKNISTV